MNGETLWSKIIAGLFGTYNQPTGTWSDDSSMTLALPDSLKDGLDYKDIMDRFLSWYEEGDYTPFDIGIVTSKVLRLDKSGIKPLQAGGTSDHDNESIPKEWLDAIVKRDGIEELCLTYWTRIEKKS